MTNPAARTRDHAATETVLLLEEDVLARIALSEYLRDCGYKVIDTARPEEAWAMLQESDLRIDVVFIAMEASASMEGFRLATWLRSNRPQIDVILAGGVVRAAKAAGELCKSGPLPRPYDPEAVARRIRQLRATRSRRQD